MAEIPDKDLRRMIEDLRYYKRLSDLLKQEIMNIGHAYEIKPDFSRRRINACETSAECYSSGDEIKLKSGQQE